MIFIGYCPGRTLQQLTSLLDGFKGTLLTDGYAAYAHFAALETEVTQFWCWCDQQCQRLDLTPSNPLSKALKYAMARVEALEVFLENPEVAIDTNHLERGLRCVPMGKKNWMFCSA